MRAPLLSCLLATAASPWMRSSARLRRAALLAALLALGPNAARAAEDPRAPPDSVYPPPDEGRTAYVIVEMAEDAPPGAWELTEANGSAVCPLPCAVWLYPSKRYSVAEHTGAARSVGLKIDPGARGTVRVTPGKGDPVGAFVLGASSSVALAGGVGLMVAVFQPSSCHSACVGFGEGLIVAGIGFLLANLGVVGGIYSVAWGFSSHRARVDFTSEPIPRLPASPSALRITLSPLGLGGTF